ncbi:phage integrase N-terminal SAM-like domain-containing protein, partial [Patescibacteria group bacterium]|nr:phage integrase N-terminal SAM-like domain-containing protein [Patescibacteria group bacterium]
MTIFTQLEKTEKELRIRNYSPKTIKSYLHGVREYLGYKKSEFQTYDEENIKNFLLSLEGRNISAQTRNMFLNAIKFYYCGVLNIVSKIEIR